MRLRIGGVPEHFNLPWRVAIEQGVFDDLDIEIEWIDFAGGTGAIMTAFDTGDIELATPLTEGAVTAIANGTAARLVAVWVSSPLLWGIHTPENSDLHSVSDLATGRFAISRIGSGSELMSRVLAEQEGWVVADDRFVPVGDLDGARMALPAGEAEIFLWNKSMTQPLVDDGTFRRVGVLPTPWPSFSVAAGLSMLSDHADVIREVVGRAAKTARMLKFDDSLPQQVADRYSIPLADATEWADHVAWQPPWEWLDTRVLGPVIDTMTRLGRIDRPIAPVDVVSTRAGRRTVSTSRSNTFTYRRYGGRDAFAEVTARLEPNPGGGIEIVSEVDEHPFIWFGAIDHGVRHAAIWPADGGDPVVDVRVVVEDFRDHAVDSNQLAFTVASRRWFDETLELTSPKPL